MQPAAGGADPAPATAVLGVQVLAVPVVQTVISSPPPPVVQTVAPSPPPHLPAGTLTLRLYSDAELKQPMSTIPDSTTPLPLIIQTPSGCVQGVTGDYQTSECDPDTAWMRVQTWYDAACTQLKWSTEKAVNSYALDVGTFPIESGEAYLAAEETEPYFVWTCTPPPSTPSPPSPPPCHGDSPCPPAEEDGGGGTVIVAAAGGGGGAVVLLLLVVAYCMCKRRKASAVVPTASASFNPGMAAAADTDTPLASSSLSSSASQPG